MVGSPSLIQHRTDEMSKRLRLNLPLLLDGIHVHPKPEPLPPVKRVSVHGLTGTRVLTVSGCQSQDPPCRGTRAPSRGIPGVHFCVSYASLGGGRRGERERGLHHDATRRVTPIDTTTPIALTHLFEIRRDCERLVSETKVGGDCGAVLAHHGHYAPAVVFHYRLYHRNTVSQPRSSTVL